MINDLSKAQARKRKGTYGHMFDGYTGQRFLAGFDSPFSTYKETIPAANISDEKSCYIVALAVPGRRKEDFDIKLNNDMITISLEVEDRNEENRKRFARREFMYTSFSRSFRVPADIDREQITATYNDGILAVKLCKKENVQNESSIPIIVQ